MDQKIIALCVKAEECLNKFLCSHEDTDYDLDLVDANIAISEIRRLFDPVYNEAMQSADEIAKELESLNI